MSRENKMIRSEKFSAFIDIGSNSITAMIAVREQTTFKISYIHKKTTTTGLAKNSYITKEFNFTGIQIVEKEILDFIKICQSIGIKPADILAISTAISRNCYHFASNFFDSLKAKTDIDVFIISGEVEALIGRCALVFFALHELNFSKDAPVTFYDQGGTSTEVSFLQSTQVYSLNLGSLNAPTNLLASLKLEGIEGSTLICTYGIVNLIIQAIADFSGSNFQQEISVQGNEVLVTNALLEKISQLIEMATIPRDLIKHYPFISERVASFHQGAKLFEAFLMQNKPKSIICSNYGLVEGLLVEKYDKKKLQEFALKKRS